MALKNKSRISLGVTLREAFQITMGGLQSDTIAPFLFIIVLGNVLMQANPNHGIKTDLPHFDASLPDLDFTDDIIFINSKESADMNTFKIYKTKL